MADNLRDRIAAVITEAIPDNGTTNFLAVADAVIRDLALREEWGSLDHEDCGIMADTREELRPSRGETIKHRYLTEWVADA